MGAKLRDVHHLSVRVLSEGLAVLGIFPGLDGSAIAHNAYRTVYPHSVGEHPCRSCCSAASTKEPAGQACPLHMRLCHSRGAWLCQND